ncbi:MAG: hypothetical protein H0T92_10655 [Pyrinomonadaceae bacterium]|nr:hypothetical protein [Pyrinomonadaceae bacterium]
MHRRTSFIGHMLSGFAAVARKCAHRNRRHAACRRPSRSSSWIWNLHGMNTVLNVDEGLKLLRGTFGIDDDEALSAEERTMRLCLSLGAE